MRIVSSSANVLSEYEYTNVHFCDNWTTSEVGIKTFNCVTINSENKERHGLQTRHLESHLVDIMTCLKKKSPVVFRGC